MSVVIDGVRWRSMRWGLWGVLLTAACHPASSPASSSPELARSADAQRASPAPVTPEPVAVTVPDASDRDDDGIPDLEDHCPDVPEVIDGFEDEDGCPEIGCRLPVGPPSVVLTFEQGHRVPEAALGGLEDFGRALVEQGATVVEVAGHTDSSGSFHDNERLARRRATAVRAVLIDAGVPPEVLQVVVHGEQQPLAPNDTEQGRSRNRRVEIICVEGC